MNKRLMKKKFGVGSKVILRPSLQGALWAGAPTVGEIVDWKDYQDYPHFCGPINDLPKSRYVKFAGEDFDGGDLINIYEIKELLPVCSKKQIKKLTDPANWPHTQEEYNNCG